MRNGCSVSGDWCLKAWEHGYIDSSVMRVVVDFAGFCEVCHLEEAASSV